MTSKQLGAALAGMGHLNRGYVQARVTLVSRSDASIVITQPRMEHETELGNVEIPMVHLHRDERDTVAAAEPGVSLVVHVDAAFADEAGIL